MRLRETNPLWLQSASARHCGRGDRDFALASAHAADVTIATGLLAGHHDLTVLLTVLGDKGSISAPLANALQSERQICLLTLPHANQAEQPSAAPP
jgi:hypothetical protein